MKCVVNWIPLTIRVRSRNTQPHLNSTFRVSSSTERAVQYLKSCSGDFNLQNLILRTRLCGTGVITQHSCVVDFRLTEICHTDMICIIVPGLLSVVPHTTVGCSGDRQMNRCVLYSLCRSCYNCNPFARARRTPIRKNITHGKEMNCCVPVLASSCVRVQEAKLKKIFFPF